MKKILVVFVAVAGVIAVGLAFTGTNQQSRKINLPTSKTLTVPVPGFIGGTNSYPATIALSPDGRFAALLNQGFGTEPSGVRQSIAVLDLSNNQLRDFPDERLPGDAKATLLSYFIGLAFSHDGRHLYASMASTSENGIAVYSFADGQVTPERFITIPNQPLGRGQKLVFSAGKAPAGAVPPYPAGLALLPSAQGDRLLVADNLSDNAVLLDVTSGKILGSFDLSAGRFVPSTYPYTVLANKAGTRAWVSLWNASAVAELDLATMKVARRIELWPSSDPVAPSAHPTTMLLSPAEDVLYVAISNAATAGSDGIAAVDLNTGKARRLYHVALSSAEDAGAAPIGMALSPDGKRLYAASASLNAVAVFETMRNKPAPAVVAMVEPSGFIPTEWYPSALAIAGDDLLVANGKGEGSGPNNAKDAAPTELHPNSAHPYIATLIGGSVQRLSLDDLEKHLPAFTQQVKENNLLLASAGELAFAGGKNPIRHVVYILKENRTYDQILGDLPAGDGDPSLTMYGAEITPNEHKLALQFGVLDNFYDSGDVSANGHLWSDASATSDYIEKIWPIIYRRSDRPEDYGNPLEQGLPELDDPGTGFLWDNLRKHHFTYRIYGEMLDAVWCRDEKAAPPRGGKAPVSAACPSAMIKPGEALPSNVGNPPGGPSPWPWAVPRLRNERPTKEAQRDHIDPLFADFAIDYPDQLRADEFLREFDQFVKARGSAKELPQFIELWLPNDHTGGTRAGRPAPRASVADNDLAVGRVVEAVSHSPYWDDTAIFVVEDDAQDGADHVDAHRSIALVISKYSPRSDKPFVDHHFYTTVGMIHTMEALIGLPPMNLFDAHAPLMAPLFTGPGTQPPYQADDRGLRNGLLFQMNSEKAPGAKQSEKMDFSRPDVNDAAKLNAILWRDAKGDTPMPAARHRRGGTAPAGGGR